MLVVVAAAVVDVWIGSMLACLFLWFQFGSTDFPALSTKQMYNELHEAAFFWHKSIWFPERT